MVLERTGLGNVEFCDNLEDCFCNIMDNLHSGLLKGEIYLLSTALRHSVLCVACCHQISTLIQVFTLVTDNGDKGHKYSLVNTCKFVPHKVIGKRMEESSLRDIWMERSTISNMNHRKTMENQSIPAH